MRSLATCVGTLTLRIPKLRTGSFFPDDAIERYQRVDRALVTAVAEMYATGTSARKVQRVAEKMGVSRPSKDQVSAIASSLDADIDELCSRPLEGEPVPYVWLDATYVECCRGGRVASAAVVTAIGCDAGGRGRALGVGVVDTESYDSWLAFLGRTLNGNVVAHGPDEGDPDGERLAAVLEDGAREGGVNLLSQQRQRHLGTPAAVDPSLQAPRASHSGHPGSGRQAAAASASVPTRPPRGSASRRRLL